MRSNKEINTEAAALRSALLNRSRWNEQAREVITQSIRVLDMRLSADEIQNTYYVDETMDDYQEGQNDLYNALMLVHYWMIGDRGYDPPSKDL